MLTQNLTLSDQAFSKNILNKYQKKESNSFNFPFMIFVKNMNNIIFQKIKMDFLIHFSINNRIEFLLVEKIFHNMNELLIWSKINIFFKQFIQKPDILDNIRNINTILYLQHRINPKISSKKLNYFSKLPLLSKIISFITTVFSRVEYINISKVMKQLSTNSLLYSQIKSQIIRDSNCIQILNLQKQGISNSNDIKGFISQYFLKQKKAINYNEHLSSILKIDDFLLYSSYIASFYPQISYKFYSHIGTGDHHFFTYGKYVQYANPQISWAKMSQKHGEVDQYFPARDENRWEYHTKFTNNQLPLNLNNYFQNIPPQLSGTNYIEQEEVRHFHSLRKKNKMEYYSHLENKSLKIQLTDNLFFNYEKHILDFYNYPKNQNLQTERARFFISRLFSRLYTSFNKKNILEYHFQLEHKSPILSNLIPNFSKLSNISHQQQVNYNFSFGDEMVQHLSTYGKISIKNDTFILGISGGSSSPYKDTKRYQYFMGDGLINLLITNKYPIKINGKSLKERFQNWEGNKNIVKNINTEVVKYDGNLTSNGKSKFLGMDNENLFFNKTKKVELEVEELKKMIVETKKKMNEKTESIHYSKEIDKKTYFDINIISDKVYRNIERRIRIERERRGL